MPAIGNWLTQAGALRPADTLAEIADKPVALTVRRAGRATDLAVTVRIVPGGTLAGRAQGEASAETRARVTILAPAGTDLRTGDRAHDDAGNVYLLVYVAPGQEWRVEASAVVEQ